jgi:hypothetical protein
MSASSIDRALRPYRAREQRRGLSTTRPGTLLKQQIAMRTFAEWTEQRPGFLEMDLVAHCGWSGAGQFLYTLSLVDVATGWVSCAGLRDKRSETVFRGLQRLQAELPFPILGLDGDNGSEFINQVLLGYCQSEAISPPAHGRTARTTAATRSRRTGGGPRLVGYDRLSCRARRGSSRCTT